MEPLVGRGAEMAALSRVLSCRGRRAAVVTGPAGSGKTRLLAEVMALRPPGRVWSLRGYEPETIAPLAAARELLHDLVPLPQRDTDVMVLFEAAHAGLAAHPEATLVVDDVQWLDGVTAALLHYLVRAATTDLLLVAAGRPSRVTAQLQDGLAGLLGEGAVCALRLQPLQQDDAVALARAVAPDLTVAAAAAYSRAAGGSPFWLRLLVQDGAVGAATLVRSRLEACSAEAQDLARLLAVAARPLSDVDTGQAMGWDRGTLTAAVEELDSRGLVTATAGVLSTTHDLVRDAVVSELSPESLRATHRRVATQLESMPGLTSLVGALQHRRAAGEPVRDLLRQLVQAPERKLLDSDAVTALATFAEAPDVRRDGELIGDLAELAASVGEPAVALPLWRRAAEAPASRPRALLEGARAAYQAGDLASAHQLLSTARAEQPDPAAAVRLDVLEASILRWGEERFSAASELADAALTAARGLGSRSVLVEALTASVEDALGRGDIDAVLTRTEEVAALARGDEELEHRVLVYRLLGLQLREEHAAAAELAGRHWRQAAEDAQPAYLLEAGVHLLGALTEMGRLDEAREVLRRTEPLLERGSVLSRRFDIGLDLARITVAVQVVHALTGAWGPAVERVLAAAGDTSRHLATFQLRWAAALVVRLGAAEDEARGEAMCERALANAVSVGCPRCLHETQLETARLLAVLGRRDRAREVIPPVPGASRMLQRWHRWATAVLDADSDGLAALRQEYAAGGSHLDALWVGLDLAACSEPEAAVPLLQVLLTESEAGGAVNVAAVVRRRLRHLGDRSWRRGAASASVLTAREQEVAELLATGATNPEIAARLFLSRKTVEHHVSHVLAKLGARNRTEVGVLIRDG